MMSALSGSVEWAVSLAKAVYNKFFHSFQGKRRSRSMQVLIVLDDISDSQQLQILVRDQNWFGPGSRIIVTTQDHFKFPLKSVPEELYMSNLVVLDMQYSNLRQAWKDNKPLRELEDVREIILSVAVHMHWSKNRAICKNQARSKIEEFLKKEGVDAYWSSCWLDKDLLPEWVDYESTGPALSFEMPRVGSCKLNWVTICVVYESNQASTLSTLLPVYRVAITNKTNKLELIHRINIDGWQAAIAIREGQNIFII